MNAGNNAINIGNAALLMMREVIVVRWQDKEKITRQYWTFSEIDRYDQHCFILCSWGYYCDLPYFGSNQISYGDLQEICSYDVNVDVDARINKLRCFDWQPYDDHVDIVER